AGSIVAYLLGITHIDPLRYKLLFERFLNPDRVSPPDFDIDLCERRRHEVIEYVRDKYGADRVVQIGTFGTLKAKAVIKDVCRALGRPPEEANSLTKLIPNHPKMTLKKALEGDPENKIPPSEELKQLLETEPWVQEVWKYAEILEGLNRNMSIHAAGVIIGDMPVAEVAPIAKGAGDEPITQFSAVPCEQLGLLKMDFLGLKTLTLIQDALDLVEKNTGKHIESNEIQLGDKPTYDLLNAGKTIAVFQLESPGMQKLCLRYGINRLEDLIALIALYRPGPLEFLEDFLARKQGRKAIEYDVPEMEPILEETFGIMLYQEQIMQVVQVVAGFSLGQADILRRAMGKKKKDVMNEMFGKFKDGCLARGIDEATVKAIWDKIFAFAGYGFNKSHSAAYGMLTYRTAWLKANYPAEFMAAVLTGELGNSEKLSFYLKECRAMNIKIMPPDVNVCDASFSVDGPNIRFGLVAVRGINSAFVNSIITAREKGGKFKDLLDFCERVEGNSVRNMEGLIKAGALDSFGLRRSQLLAVAAKAISIAKDSRKDKINGQMSLFDMLGGGEQNASGGLDIPDIPEWPLDELLGYEKELLGFFVSGHPISKDQAIVERYQLNDLSELVQLESGTMVRIGAYLTGVQQKTTKRGEPWVILNLENRETSIEGLMFHESFAKCKEQGLDALKPDSVVFVEGEVNRREPESEDEVVEDTEKVPETKLFVYRVVPAAKAMDAYTSEIHLRLQEQDITEEKLGGLR
ncbi:MAG: DNA polymerase III subunit alpha, partial [Victivallales bacterium]|nr:DNA polymerase III subunit alpha [Victivallales bacterium]